MLDIALQSVGLAVHMWKERMKTVKLPFELLLRAIFSLLKVVFSSNHVCIMRNRLDSFYAHWPIQFAGEVEWLLDWLLGFIEANNSSNFTI